MCEPVTLSIIAASIGAGQAGVGIAKAISDDATRHNQLRLSSQNARLARSQVATQLSQEAEANAQKNFELARTAVATQGEIRASNLGDRSVRALGRAVGFELGQDKASVARNQEIANQEARARLLGIHITRQTEKQQIGPHGGMTLALNLIGPILQGASTGMSGASLVGGSSTTADPSLMSDNTATQGLSTANIA